MSCDGVQQFLLDAGWNASRRQEISDLLRHAEQCDQCRAALADFDAVLLACSADDDEVPEPRGGWDAMVQRFTATVRKREDFWRRPWVRTTMAAAAVLLVAAGAFEAGQFLRPAPAPLARETRNEEVVPVILGLSPPEVSGAANEFHEVSRNGYGGRAGWMLVSGAESSVGVVPPGVPLSKKVLLLRLALVHGKEVVSDADLMVRAGQKADLNVRLANGEFLRYRIGTSMDEPTHLTVWLEMKTRRGGEPLAGLGTNLQVHPGEKLTAGKLITSAGEYELKIEFASAELAEDKP